MNYTEDVLTIQSKLIKSQTITIDYVKLAFLAIPTYLAYPIIGLKALGGIDITQLNIKWWMANMIFSLLITPICIWIYRQVSFKNIEKRWVRFIIDHTAGTSVTKAPEFAREIQDIKKAN